VSGNAVGAANYPSRHQALSSVAPTTPSVTTPPSTTKATTSPAHLPVSAAAARSKPSPQAGNGDPYLAPAHKKQLPCSDVRCHWSRYSRLQFTGAERNGATPASRRMNHKEHREKQREINSIVLFAVYLPCVVLLCSLWFNPLLFIPGVSTPPP
jgi:hypothetical protein